MDRVIIPKANEQDVMVEEEYEEMVEIIPVTHISEVLEIALRHMPTPLSDEEVEQDEIKAEDARKSDEDRVSTH